MTQFDCFLKPNALAINQARQDHLESLGFPMSPGTVLEVGAGIGLHTKFFVDRGCSVTITEGREDNLQEIRSRWPDNPALLLDMDQDLSIAHLGEFDMVYCYGLLYHLGDPESALRRMAEVCRGQIFLELICSTDTEESLIRRKDPGGNDQSTVGQACRPSRSWILSKLRQYFGHGYISVTQPDHIEFPIDWQSTKSRNTRAVFVGSKVPLVNDLLSEVPLQQQKRYLKGPQRHA
jgi:SAM-dependent methyltransferase